jgi:hypothetical protein
MDSLNTLEQAPGEDKDKKVVDLQFSFNGNELLMSEVYEDGSKSPARGVEGFRSNNPKDFENKKRSLIQNLKNAGRWVGRE